MSEEESTNERKIEKIDWNGQGRRLHIYVETIVIFRLEKNICHQQPVTDNDLFLACYNLNEKTLFQANKVQ